MDDRVRRGLRRLAGALLGIALCVSLCGCAWSNRANRPVWNAFEANLVPSDDTAFYATLPLTIPAGLVSVLLDTFIVHPAQVADDAWNDAGDLWNHMDWKGEYYTELASLPFRAVGTPIVFVVMFLARSAFDIPPHGADAAAPDSPETEQAPDGDAEAAATPASSDDPREQELLARLRRIAAGRTGARDLEFEDAVPTHWTPALDAACEAALAGGNGYARLRLYEFLRRRELPPWRRDPLRGLRDADPVVRYHELDHLPSGITVPAGLRERLRHDPDEVVRALAKERLE